MPKVLEDRVQAIMRKGTPKSNAFAIATAALQREGKLQKGTQKPTRKGK